MLDGRPVPGGKPVPGGEPVLDDPEDADPHQARGRTRLAWTRTAIAFAAVGIAVLKTNVPAGLTVLALAPVVWLIGRTSVQANTDQLLPRQLRLITAAIMLVALVALVIVLLGRGPGFHPPSHVPR